MPFSVEKFGIKYSLVDYKKEFKKNIRYSYESSIFFSENFSDQESLNMLGVEDSMLNPSIKKSECDENSEE